MRNTIFTIILLGLFLACLLGVQPAQAQLFFGKTLSADSQDDLPVTTEQYQAGGHLFNWTFEWTNQSSNPSDASVLPRVVSSNLNVEIENGSYGNGYRKVSGTGDTGYPSDYLQISEVGGSVHGRFTDMVFTVNYYNLNGE
jgi:hypothetical protein